MKKPPSGHVRVLVADVEDTSAEALDNEWPVAGDAEGAAFVGGGDEPEKQLGAGVVGRGEPDFVDEDEVVAEQGLDYLPDAVVGQVPVEGVGQVGGGEIP